MNLFFLDHSTFRSILPAAFLISLVCTSASAQDRSVVSDIVSNQKQMAEISLEITSLKSLVNTTLTRISQCQRLLKFYNPATGLCETNPVTEPLICPPDHKLTFSGNAWNCDMIDYIAPPVAPQPVTVPLALGAITNAWEEPCNQAGKTGIRYLTRGTIFAADYTGSNGQNSGGISDALKSRSSWRPSQSQNPLLRSNVVIEVASFCHPISVSPPYCDYVASQNKGWTVNEPASTGGCDLTCGTISGGPGVMMSMDAPGMKDFGGMCFCRYPGYASCTVGVGQGIDEIGNDRCDAVCAAATVPSGMAGPGRTVARGADCVCGFNPPRP